MFTRARIILAAVLAFPMLACGGPDSPGLDAAGRQQPPPAAGFLYVTTERLVHAFRVQPETGSLERLSGSPFPGGAADEVGPLLLAPATHMLFPRMAGSPYYQADPRSGALQVLGAMPRGGGPALDPQAARASTRSEAAPSGREASTSSRTPARPGHIPWIRAVVRSPS